MVEKGIKTSDLIIACLENEGIEFVVGVPGEENLDFLESLRKSTKLKLILTRHEQAAAFIATTIGRLTGKPAVALSTLGPGATNMITGAAYATLGAMPLVMITGQKPIRRSKQGHFQIIDTVLVMRPVTKYAKQIVSGANAPSMVREAFRISMEERPGATHLELPEDIAREIVEDVVPFTVHPTRRPIAEDKAINAAVQCLKEAKYPLLVIAAGSNRKTTSRMLSEMVDKTGIPFVVTQMGKGVIDERHPLYLGTAALSANDYVHLTLKKADVIVNIGHDVVEKPPFFMQRQGGAKVIHINFYSAEVDQVYFPQIEVVGDIANAVWQIKEKLDKQPHWDFQYFMKVKHHFEEHLKVKEMDSRFPAFPQRVVASVRKVMPNDGILTLDNGMYKIWFARDYKAHIPNSILLDNALATMGAGLPCAMGARLVYPDFSRKIVAVCGDGGFMMNSQEMETCVRLKLNITIIILNDSGYGMIKWKQADMGLPNFGLEYTNPDFEKYAESYGAKGYRIKAIEEFEPTFERCLKEEGVHLIDLPIDYTENSVFSQELKMKKFDGE